LKLTTMLVLMLKVTTLKSKSKHLRTRRKILRKTSRLLTSTLSTTMTVKRQ